MQDYTQLIAARDLAANLGRPDWCVVDCRFDLAQPHAGRLQYAAAHVPGAVYAHLDEELAAPVTAGSGRHPLPARDALSATLRGWGISNDTQVVAYDDGSGALAARLWWLLRWLGHRRVALLDGGLAAWQRAGGPLSRDAAQPRPGRFVPAASSLGVVDTGELAARLGGDDPLPLVDARARDRYAGVREPIDRVAGHVPGAKNFPFAQNIGEDGCWRPAATLRQAWEALFGGRTPPDWAVMCGSGVTACHLVLSAEIAGIAPPRLYAGSWSEWIRDPARAVATGER